MSSSPDLVVNILFGIIMVLVGIAAIWVVRWQTYFLLRRQGKLAFICWPGLAVLTIPLLGPMNDEERASHISGLPSTDAHSPAAQVDALTSQADSLAKGASHSSHTSNWHTTACIPRSDTDFTAVSTLASDTTACTVSEIEEA
jgi:hypothetical protein